MKIFLVLVIASCTLFASLLQDGFNFYKNDNYIRAYEKFYLLHVKNRGNMTISVYMAKTLFHLGEYQRVKEILLPIYKKVKNEEASLFLAKVYFYEKNYTKAKEILLGIKPKDHKADISKLLGKIEDATKLHTFSARLSLRVVHDDNIHNNTFAPFTQYNGTTRINNTNKTKDVFVDKILFLSHSYKLPSIENTTWHDNFLLFDRSGIDYSNENFSYGSIKSGPVIKNNGYTVSPQILLDDSYYESEHYRYSYGLGLIVEKNIKSSFRVRSKISYTKAKYIQNKDKTQNANIYKFLLHLKHNITTSDILNYQFSYEDTNKNETGRYDISKDVYYYSINYFKRLPKNYNLALGVQYIDYRYKDTYPSFGKREDVRTIYKVRLIKNLRHYYNLSANYTYTYNNSNISLYSYKKKTFSIMLSKYF